MGSGIVWVRLRYLLRGVLGLTLCWIYVGRKTVLGILVVLLHVNLSLILRDLVLLLLLCL
jgi:hypothetical protein